MSTGTTPWNVLSDAITKKIGTMRERAQKAKDQETQTEYKAWEGILNNPASTEEERQSALDHMKKAVPKDAIPIVEGYHKVVSAVHKMRGKSKQLGQQTQGQGQGQQQGQQLAQSGPGPNPNPVNSNSSSTPGAAPTTPAPKPPSDLTLPKALSDVAARAPAQAGKAAGQEEAAKEEILSKGREEAADRVRKYYKDKGKEMPEGLDEALSYEAATGKNAPAGTLSRKMQRVTVRDPNDPSRRIPALQDMSSGVVFGPDGSEIPNPEVVSSAILKPKQGWKKEGGKIIGVMLDPLTGQTIPGSENPNILPPAGYLDKVQEGYIGFTDSDNNFVLVPKTTRTHPNVPDTGTGGVPSDMKGPSKGQGKGQDKGQGAGVSKVGVPDNTGKHLPPGSIVVGQKPAGAQARSRADAARAIKPLIARVEELLQDPEVANNMGPLSGRLDTLEKRVGNLPGKLRELAGTLVSIYSLGGAMHGWRSSQVAEKFASTYGDLTSTPDSLRGGMKAMLGTATTVENVGYPPHMESPDKSSKSTSGKIKVTAEDMANAGR